MILRETNKIVVPNGLLDYYVQITQELCTYDSNKIHLGNCSIITNRRITVRVKPN